MSRHGPEVLWIAASFHCAQMVQLKPFWDRPLVVLVYGPMNKGHSTTYSRLPVSLLDLLPGPNPTSGFWVNFDAADQVRHVTLLVLARTCKRTEFTFCVLAGLAGSDWIRNPANDTALIVIHALIISYIVNALVIYFIFNNLPSNSTRQFGIEGGKSI